MFPPNNPHYPRNRSCTRCLNGTKRKGLYAVFTIGVFLCIIFAVTLMYEHHVLDVSKQHVLGTMHQSYNAESPKFVDEERRRMPDPPDPGRAAKVEAERAAKEEAKRATKEEAERAAKEEAEQAAKEEAERAAKARFKDLFRNNFNLKYFTNGDGTYRQPLSDSEKEFYENQVSLLFAAITMKAQLQSKSSPTELKEAQMITLLSEINPAGVTSKAAEQATRKAAEQKAKAAAEQRATEREETVNQQIRASPHFEDFKAEVEGQFILLESDGNSGTKPIPPGNAQYETKLKEGMTNLLRFMLRDPKMWNGTHTDPREERLFDKKYSGREDFKAGEIKYYLNQAITRGYKYLQNQDQS